MPALSTGPPAVGSPRIPLPSPSPPPPAAATGVVVFSQPARAAPTPAVRASAPPRRSRDRRDTPRGGTSALKARSKQNDDYPTRQAVVKEDHPGPAIGR